MSRGPDVAGLYAALAKVSTRAPEQRRADRAAAAVTRTGLAMREGRRYYTRSLPGAKRYVNPNWREQSRCGRGHFVQHYSTCRACAQAGGVFDGRLDDWVFSDAVERGVA